MHIYEPTVGFLGTNGVVAPGIPIAAGAALSAQSSKSGRVAVCCGHGAANNGAFHERINMATAWNLPVVYVCENNLYAAEMPLERPTRNVHVASRAQAFNLPGVRVDGNNVLAVYAETQKAVERARRGEGPTLMECLTYRWFGHHAGDPGTSYRTKEEIAAWKERDPIRKLHEEALNAGSADAEDFKKIDEEVRKVIKETAEFAFRSPQPDPSTALENVFFE